jgi:CheY-like chemotaxis protein
LYAINNLKGNNVTENGQHILVADDNELNLEIIDEHISETTFIPTFANNGQEAVDFLKGDPDKYSVILLDRMMPVIDGLQALEIIKNDTVLQKIPVIFQSAMASKKDIEIGIDAGAHYYLTKPYGGEDLLAMLDAASDDFLRQNKTYNDESSNSSQAEQQYQFSSLDEAKSIALELSNFFPDPGKVFNGIMELLINAVEHGNLGITYQEKSELIKNKSWSQEIENRLADEKYKYKKVTVSCHSSDSQCYIIIEDEGDGFDWQSYMQIDPSRAFDPHGRGIAMANLLSFDELIYEKRGKQVKAIVNISS